MTVSNELPAVLRVTFPATLGVKRYHTERHTPYVLGSAASNVADAFEPVNEDEELDKFDAHAKLSLDGDETQLTVVNDQVRVIAPTVVEP
jgi:hypothetical protein